MFRIYDNVTAKVCRKALVQEQNCNASNQMKGDGPGKNDIGFQKSNAEYFGFLSIAMLDTAEEEGVANIVAMKMMVEKIHEGCTKTSTTITFNAW